MTAWEFLIDLNNICCFQSREGKKYGKASNSELKRWLMNGALILNGQKINWNEPVNFPINSAVLFKKRQITLF